LPWLPKLYIFAPGLDIEKKTKTIAMINIVSAVMNILLNILLIPFLGIMGSALATLISSSLLFLIYMTLSQKIYAIPYTWEKIVFACLLSAFIIIIGYAISLYSTRYYYIAFVGKGLLIIAVSFFIVRRLLGRKDLLHRQS
jgi:O-antigen/teichoic acid export membrane protein